VEVEGGRWKRRREKFCFVTFVVIITSGPRPAPVNDQTENIEKSLFWKKSKKRKK
jgi:hypothetical protein